MSDGQQLITTTTPSGETALNEPFSELAQLKRIIALLQNDIKEKDARLRGVHALTKICQDLGEKGSHWESKAKNYETCLKRAEARITQLNKMLGIGPQAAFNRGAMFPGVSRKDFELVTQENIKLKKSLDHIVATDLGGHDVIMKNRELYELVSVLHEDLSQSGNHIKELESALRSDENGVNGRVPELTRKLMKLERSLKAKQVFCEALIKENERLKKSVDEGSSSDNQEPSQDFTDARNKEENSQRVDPALIEKMNSLGAEIEVMKKHIEERDEIISDFSRTLEVLETENEKLTGNASDLETAFKIKEQEYQQKLNAEKDQLTKKCADLQKKCNGFFKQVVSLNAKQQESETEVDRVKREFEHQTAELEEKKSKIHLLTESLKSYEDDFCRENEEKAKIQKVLDKAQQESERTKRENQSHMAAIQHLEDEFERMNKLLNEERKRGIDMKNKGIDVPAMIEKMNSLGTEIKVMKKHIEERDEIISDFSRKLEVLETENEKLTGNALEFEEAFKSKEQEYQQKLNAEKDQLTKKCADLQKKCDGFFKQVVSLNAKQQESETEVDRVKREFEHQTAELEEKKSKIHLLTESLKSYEDDFCRENEEKAKIQKVLDKAQQESERTKRENQSHMAAIQHLEDEFERMNKLLNEERKRGNDMRNKGIDVPAMIEKMNSLGTEIKVMKKHIEERDEIISDFSRKLEVLETENEKLTGNASEFEEAFKSKEQEYQQKLNAEKDQLTRKCADLQKKCDGFFKQVVSLYAKQQESETEVDQVKRAFEHQTAELEEKKSMIHLLTESLKSYEDDFRRESEGKAKIQKVLGKAQREHERKNQSHMATIQHLQDEFERMNKLLNEERKRRNDMRSKGNHFGTPAHNQAFAASGPRSLFLGNHFGMPAHNQAFAASGTRSLFLEHRPIQVVDDDSGGGFYVAEGNRKQNQHSMPTTKSEGSNAPSLVECPYCSRSYPYHLIEGHVQDCMEDSLYVDDRD